MKSDTAPSPQAFLDFRKSRGALIVQLMKETGCNASEAEEVISLYGATGSYKQMFAAARSKKDERVKRDAEKAKELVAKLEKHRAKKQLSPAPDNTGVK